VQIQLKSLRSSILKYLQLLASGIIMSYNEKRSGSITWGFMKQTALLLVGLIIVNYSNFMADLFAVIKARYICAKAGCLFNRYQILKLPN
jgi:hypothetical protein